MNRCRSRAAVASWRSGDKSEECGEGNGGRLESCRKSQNEENEVYSSVEVVSTQKHDCRRSDSECEASQREEIDSQESSDAQIGLFPVNSPLLHYRYRDNRVKPPKHSKQAFEGKTRLSCGALLP